MKKFFRILIPVVIVFLYYIYYKNKEITYYVSSNEMPIIKYTNEIGDEDIGIVPQPKFGKYIWERKVHFDSKVNRIKLNVMFGNDTVECNAQINSGNVIVAEKTIIDTGRLFSIPQIILEYNVP